MKNISHILFFLLITVSAYGQLCVDVSNEGKVDITIDEPNHYLLKHPSKFEAPLRDTTRFNKYTFHYVSNDYNRGFKVFPPLNWGNDYKIVDSNKRKITYAVRLNRVKRHLGPLSSKEYRIDAKYSKDGRLKSTLLYPLASGVDEDSIEIKWSRKLIKYKFDAFGLKKTTGGIKYERDKDGNLKYFLMSYLEKEKLSNAEIYDSLNREIINGSGNLLKYHIYKFMGVIYKDSLITEYIHLSMANIANKVTIEYDNENRAVRIVDFPEDEKHASCIVEIKYIGNTNKVDRVIKTEYATNWEYKIIDKRIWRYNYDNGEVKSIIIDTWDSYQWDNDYFLDESKSVSKEILVN
ncbi:MAG: hypothetical protein WEA99_10005 [Brumimicrobium sp.]